MDKQNALQLEENLKTLLFGDKKDFKETKRNIEKMWRKDSEVFAETAPFVLESIKKFDEIENSQNKAAFISGLDLFFLALADDYFEELKLFTIKAIQHPNGSVRQAIIHTSKWLGMSLCARIDSEPRPRSKIKKHDLKRESEIAKKQLLDLVLELEGLIEKNDDESENEEYVDDMKPSIFKSLQVLWNDFTDMGCYRKLTEENRPIPSELFFKRKEIEDELNDLLKRSKSFADIDFIKDIIYRETGTEDFQRVIELFDTGHKNAPEIGEYLEVINDAWNHFPHKNLNGLCPLEMFEKYKNSH